MTKYDQYQVIPPYFLSKCHIAKDYLAINLTKLEKNKKLSYLSVLHLFPCCYLFASCEGAFTEFKEILFHVQVQFIKYKTAIKEPILTNFKQF